MFPAMFPTIPATFGAITQDGNWNLKAEGVQNRGDVLSNCNGTVNCTNCILNLRSNANMKIRSTNSTLSLASSANIVVNGTGNTLVARRGANLKFDGDHNNCTMSGNSNAKFTCNNSKVILEDNSNLKISGDNNDVTAKNNANLTVEGDRNKIHVENTENHLLFRGNNVFKVKVGGHGESSVIVQGRGSACVSSGSSVSVGQSRGNVSSVSSIFVGNGRGSTSVSSVSSVSVGRRNVRSVSSIFVGTGRSFSSVVQGHGSSLRMSISPSINYSVSYEDEARIEKDAYTIGIFNFKRRNGEDFVDVEIDETELEPGSLEVVGSTGQEVTLWAAKEGVKQQLTLEGPRISRLEDGNVWRIHLSGKRKLSETEEEIAPKRRAITERIIGDEDSSSEDKDRSSEDED